MDRPKLRVGAIVDEGSQSNAFFELFEQSRQSELYSIELLIVQRKTKGPKRNALQKAMDYVGKRGVAKTLAKVMFAVITRIEKALFARGKLYAPHFRRHGLEKFDVEKLALEPLPSKSGFVVRYSDTDLAKIKERNLDVLIRGGSGILRGGILTVAPMGIVSFHHANNRVNRGAPPGFWEVYHREPSTGFIIQKLSEELDGGDVLFRGAIPTAPTYVRNSVRLYLKANAFMHALLERIARTGALPQCEAPQPYAYPLYTTPTVGQQIRYLWNVFLTMGGKVWRVVRGHKYRWGVAYQFTRSWRDAVLWRSKVIKNPPNKFLADPFVVTRSGRNVIYVEEYDFGTDLGRITAYEVTKAGATPLGVALEEPFHLSFPFLLEQDGELYMCPDTHEAREIRLYKCTEFPLTWELHRVLKNNVSATDTMIFKRDGKWWMFTNVDSSPLGDHCSELHIFSADAFDSTDWRPHPLNPVMIDSTRARNGGLLFDGETAFRVFQVQGFDRYGEAMGIAEIKTLDAEHYAEAPLCTMPARFMPGLEGAHTYSYTPGLLALDFVKFEGRG
jgi:methionyl-tRNA formyltransferase